MSKNSTRGQARSRTPHSKAFLKFIASGWDQDAPEQRQAWPVAPFAAERRRKLAQQFAGKVLIIEAGDSKTRSNDTEYRYRPHSAFAHLTGWGSESVPGSILVIDARTKSTKSTLYLRPTAGRDSTEFFANSAIGEFWVGKRPSLVQISDQLGVATKDIAKFADFKTKVGKLGIGISNAKLAEAVSVLRFVKDAHEIAEMRKAVNASIQGFEDVVRSLPAAQKVKRGERVIEGAFFARARLEGNDLGYETISAAGANACTLHWIRNDGPVRAADLILVDAGVEVDSLYTADITRTLPVSGKFSPIQLKIYSAVLKAQDAAFAVAKPGVKFREVHEAAMRVIAAETEAFGILPVSASESLEAKSQLHRRWMVHGTSHHLGLDVHDCAQAKREMYLEAELEEGMIFTIEPGLYFHADDLTVPEEFRGIGVRIEDDVLVTADGVENLSGKLPRDPAKIEAWMAALLA